MQTKQCLNSLFVDCFNIINSIEEKALKIENVKLSISEIHVLDAINKSENPTMSNVAKTLFITTGSLTTAIDGLVRKGYVKRISDDNDRRKVLLFLEDIALPIIKIHTTFHETMIDAVINNFHLNDQSALILSLQQLITFFQEKGTSLYVK